MIISSFGIVSSAADTSTVSTVVNGDFENGLEGFVIEKGSHKGAVIEAKADSTGKRSGNVLDVNSGTEHGSLHTFRIYQSVAVEKNTEYVWEFYINVLQENNHYVGVVEGNTVNAEGNTTRPISCSVLEGEMDSKPNTIADGAQLKPDLATADPNWIKFKSEGAGWCKVRIGFNSAENTNVCLAYVARAKGRLVLFDDWKLGLAPIPGEIKNGDFENGATHFTNHDAITFEVIEEPGNTSNHVLHVMGGNPSGAVAKGCYYQTVAVEKNTDYIWKFKMKHIGTNGVSRIYVYPSNGNNGIILSSISHSANGYSAIENDYAYIDAYYHEWVEFTVKFNSGDNLSVKLWHNAWTQSRDMYTDDWSLKKAPEIGKVINGDFENGLQGFVVEEGSFSETSVTTVDDSVRSGKVLSINTGTDHGDKLHSFRVYQPVPVNKNTDYVWDFYVQPIADKNQYIGVVAGDTVSASKNTTLPINATVLSGTLSFSSNTIADGAQRDQNNNADPNWLSFGAKWNWKRIRVTFNSGDNDYVCLSYGARGKGREVLFDDWQLFEKPNVGKIVNGDFENGYTGFENVSTETFEVIKDNDTLDNNVLHIGNGGKFCQTVEVKKNTDYIWSFRFKKLDDAGAVYFDAVALDDTVLTSGISGEGDTVYAKMYNGTGAIDIDSGKWGTYTIKFNSGDNDYVKLQGNTWISGRDMLTDDWTLKEGAKAGELVNGDFENGTEGFTVTPNAAAQINSEEVHGGNSSFKLSGTSEADYGQIVYQQILVEKNTDYIWNFWYKSDTDNASLVAVMTNDGSKLLPSYIKTFAPFVENKKSFVLVRDNAYTEWHESLEAKHWKKYSVVFNSGDNTSVRLAIDLVNNQRSGFTDDWSIEKYNFTLGDADNDGRIDAKDLVSVKQELLGRNAVFFKNGADINESGKVDVLDLVRLKKELVKIEEYSPRLNGIKLSDYAIIYSDEYSDYSKRAAEYIYSEILNCTGIELAVYEENEKTEFNYEIVVGETARDISDNLNADTTGMQFAILADKNSIALEGDYFIVAAAAYYFVDTYISNGDLNADIPKTLSVHNPIVKKAKNYIVLIGDGMGPNQTLLFDTMTDVSGYSDGEKQFYGYYFPYLGAARTDSLSGTTDSAAAGTALATGYKTNNGYIGQDKNHTAIQSITELAALKGMSTAVMSTEATTGATPAAFSAHANSRNDSSVILANQKEMTKNYGTIIKGGFNYYDKKGIATLEKNITDTLNILGKNENGFFMMYEEAYIDKHGHSQDIDAAFLAVIRFNQAIARFMEYAFYNPETFVLITADHETGNLLPDENGGYSYNCGDHTNRDVLVFAYGSNAELFGGKTIENVQIPMTIASFMGVTDFGEQTTYKYLTE